MSGALIGAVVGAGWGMFSASHAAKAAAAEADRRRAAEILGAKRLYSATEDSTNIMKGVAREQAANAINEALRAGMANDNQVKKEIDVVASKQLASSEGLTSGRSRGRAMVTTYIKGNQALAQSKTQTASMINQIIDQKDKLHNDMNNRLLQAHQEMTSILTTPANVFEASWVDIVSGGLSGAASGASLGASLGSA